MRYSIEIADALSQAHLRGIIHRDLKPANIILTKSGAKLLDFGLSKIQIASGNSDESSQTAEGTILGTLQYMAPEQLEGKEADARSDIFSFGAIMYEMATGRKAFQADSQAGLISAMMTSEPKSIAEIQPCVPAAFDDLVRACQGKDPGARWQSVHDVLLQLRSIALRTSTAEAVSTHHGTNIRRSIIKRHKKAAVALVGIVAALIGLGWLVLRRSTKTSAELAQRRLTFNSSANPVTSAAISPDGRVPDRAGTDPV